MKTLAAIALFCATTAPLLAGIPTEETAICPIGGEEFTITGTASCTTMGRTMSLRPVTSCDFVTYLPVCPENGLPIYKDFSQNEVETLTPFLETPAFQSLTDLPPWQRAYRTELHLRPTGSDLLFALLLNAMWRESDEFFQNPALMAAFVAASAEELPRIEPDERPFVEAIVVYVLAQAGKNADANKRLQDLQTRSDLPDYLRAYLSALSACLADINTPQCAPGAPFVP